MAQCAHKLNELRSVFRCWWCLRRLLQSVLSECSRSEHCGVLQRTIKCNLDFDRVPGRRPKTTAYSTFSSKNPLKSNAAAWQMTNMFVHRITTIKTWDYNWTINAFEAINTQIYWLFSCRWKTVYVEQCIPINRLGPPPMPTAWARLNSFRCSFSIIYLISYWFTHIHAKAHHT